MIVSRETQHDLETYCSLVEKWNPKVNLVSRASLVNLWDRHIKDSLQLLTAETDQTRWVDIGSGGGFPGLVVAIVQKTLKPDAQITLIESDQRKSVFLKTVVRELGLNAVVRAARIENVEPLNASTLSARALAPLTNLLSFAHTHLSDSGQAVFPKGSNWEKEVEIACQEWSFGLRHLKSYTDPSAAILVIRDIKKL